MSTRFQVKEPRLLWRVFLDLEKSNNVLHVLKTSKQTYYIYILLFYYYAIWQESVVLRYLRLTSQKVEDTERLKQFVKCVLTTQARQDKNVIKQEAMLSQRGRAMLRVCIASIQNVERSLLLLVVSASDIPLRTIKLFSVVFLLFGVFVHTAGRHKQTFAGASPTVRSRAID